MFPSEHGASVILVGSLLCGWLLAGTLGLAPVAMIAAMGGAYLARGPLVRVARGSVRRGSDSFRRNVRWAGIYSALVLVGILGLLASVMPAQRLLWLGAASLPLLGLAIGAGVARKEREAWSELGAVLALCFGAPAMVVVATPSAPVLEPALRAYALALLFFGGGFMHIRIALRRRRAARGDARKPKPALPAWLWSAASIIAALGAATIELLPLPLALAVSPALLRPLLLRRFIDKPVRAGLAETGLSLLFLLGVALAV